MGSWITFITVSIPVQEGVNEAQGRHVVRQSHVVPQCHHASEHGGGGGGAALPRDLSVEVDEVVAAVDGDVGKASALGVEIGVWGREGMGGVSVCGGGGGREG